MTRRFRCNFTAGRPPTSNFEHGQTKGYLGCISGWLGALRGSPGSQIVDLGCRDTEWVGGNDKNVLDAIVPGRHHTSHFEHEQRKLANLSAFLLGLGP